MRHRDPSRRLCRRILATPALLFGVLAWPAVAAADPSCTIEPQGPAVEAGAKVQWSAKVEDISKDRRNYAWSFEQGSPGASDRPKVEVRHPGAGTWSVRLEVTDGKKKRAVCTTTVQVGRGAPPSAPTAPCDPVPADAATAHSRCITAYTGPEVCVACHKQEARDMHGSVHYQQGGAFPNLDNVPGHFFAAGERPAHPAGELVATGINTYCGTHENSPRFTCAGCHVGNGRFPKSGPDFDKLDHDNQLKELANIDCLMCHQEAYKRFPDPTPGFEPLVLMNLCLDAAGNLIDPREDARKCVLPTPDVACPPPDKTSWSVCRTGLAGIPIVDSVTADFEFIPADPETYPALVDLPDRFKMTITALEAAQTVHATTRGSCLNCHAGAAGADGAKRGDLSRQLASNATPTLDYHMSPQGANKTCSDCHSVDGHRLRGRGLDLRANDVVDPTTGEAELFTCESCHGERPHGDYSANEGGKRDTHAAKVACQTCHIPTYAKAEVGTEVARDWQDPHASASACNGRGGWLPREDKGKDLTPIYTWFDGKSEVHYLGEPLAGVPTIGLAANVAASFAGDFQAGDPAYVLGAPSAIITPDGRLDPRLGVTNKDAKLYPMKEHWGKLASNGETLIGHSTFEFFRTGSFCRGVAVGLGVDPDAACPEGVPGTEMPPGTEAVAVHTFQTINHGVEPEDNALACGACHASKSGGPVRLDLKATLGYGLRMGDSVVIRTDRPGPLNGDLNRICTQCHENEREKRDFDGVHAKHVADKKRDCAACHEFSRPERGLSLTKED